MLRRLLRAGVLVSTLLAGGLGLALLAPSPEPAREAKQAPAAAAPVRYAQQMAMNCRTATTVCPLPAAAPIGAPCMCGSEAGTAAP